MTLEEQLVDDHEEAVELMGEALDIGGVEVAGILSEVQESVDPEEAGFSDSAEAQFVFAAKQLDLSKRWQGVVVKRKKTGKRYRILRVSDDGLGIAEFELKSKFG